MGVNSLPKTVTRQRRGCDLNPSPSAPESSTLTTRLPSCPTYIHTYIHSKSYSAQSYTKTERLCSTKTRPYTSNELNKSNVKSCVFRAREKAACESVSLTLTGRLFQMSGSQTDKTFRLNWVVRRTTADLAADDRSWRTWRRRGGTLTLNVTRSLRYGGELWWKIRTLHGCSYFANSTEF